jgi:predicted DNA-binding transcriptional regulator AlpA
MNNQKPTTIIFDNLSDEALLREKQLYESQVIPFSASTLWRKVKKGDFPKPIKLSDQITAWRVKDIRQWLSDPISYKFNSNYCGGANHA